MPEETTQQVDEQQPETTDGPEHGLIETGLDPDAAHEAAERFLKERDEEIAESHRARDDKGRFVKKDETDSQPEGAAKPEPKPEQEKPAPHPAGLGDDWVDAARSSGLTDAEINSAKNTDDIVNLIEGKRRTQATDALSALGITEQEYAALMRARQGYSQQQDPRTQPTQPTEQPKTTPEQAALAGLPDDFQLSIDENDFSPEVTNQLKAVADYVNKLKAGFQAALTNEVGKIHGQLKQSAETVQQQEWNRDWDDMWHQTANKVPEFVQAFGSFDELQQAARQGVNNAKVVKLRSFAPYFEDKLQKYTRLFMRHENDRDGIMRAMEMATRDGLKAFHEARGVTPQSNGTNGHSQTQTFGEGSVVRSARRRNDVSESIGDEIERVSNVIADAWATTGRNPFAGDE